MGIHQQRTHPTHVKGCKPCKWSTVNLHMVGLPDAAAQRILEAKRNEFECNAYRKLVSQGVQPNGSKLTDLVEARNKTRLRDEPYDATTDDGTRDWGDYRTNWTTPDGLGDHAPGELQGALLP